ncbi:MAG: V-type ATPase subunit [Synergistaceae bacterium]|nr:V-type ATPase subunit [Synergistaceae bacterium]
MSYSSRGERVSIGVKAKVLYSRLLSPDEYWVLLGSDTVGEIAQKLRATAYGEALSTLSADPHRNDIEAVLKNAILHEAANFAPHLSSPRDKFFRTWVRWHESEYLKSVFRYIGAGRMDRDEIRRRFYAIKSSNVSYDNILSARNFTELSDNLRGSLYFSPLADSLKRLASGEEHSLFPLEMALDNFNELSLFKSLKKLELEEGDTMLQIFGVRADLYNIYTLYRAMTFYSMTPEEILNRLLPMRYRIKLPFLREAVRVESFSQTVELLNSEFPAYAELFMGALASDEPQLSLERNIKRYIYNQAKRVLSSGLPGFHTVMGYFILKEYEINDIIHITEAVRYGYDRRRAAAYLIRPIISGGETEWQ